MNSPVHITDINFTVVFTRTMGLHCISCVVALDLWDRISGTLGYMRIRPKGAHGHGYGYDTSQPAMDVRLE